MGFSTTTFVCLILGVRDATENKHSIRVFHHSIARGQYLAGVIGTIRELADVVKEQVIAGSSLERSQLERSVTFTSGFTVWDRRSLWGLLTPRRPRTKLQKIEKIFAIMECISEQRVSITTFILKGKAGH